VLGWGGGGGGGRDKYTHTDMEITLGNHTLQGLNLSLHAHSTSPSSTFLAPCSKAEIPLQCTHYTCACPREASSISHSVLAQSHCGARPKHLPTTRLVMSSLCHSVTGSAKGGQQCPQASQRDCLCGQSGSTRGEGSNPRSETSHLWM